MIKCETHWKNSMIQFTSFYNNLILVSIAYGPAGAKTIVFCLGCGDAQQHSIIWEVLHGQCRNLGHQYGGVSEASRGASNSLAFALLSGWSVPACHQLCLICRGLTPSCQTPNTKPIKLAGWWCLEVCVSREILSTCGLMVGIGGLNDQKGWPERSNGRHAPC